MATAAEPTVNPTKMQDMIMNVFLLVLERNHCSGALCNEIKLNDQRLIMISWPNLLFLLKAFNIF